MNDHHAENGQGYTAAASYPGYRQPELHTLPSGAEFLLRKPQVMKMLRKGQIPNPLMEVVNSVFNIRDEMEVAAEAEKRGVSVEQARAELQQEREDEAAEHPAPPDPSENVTAADGIRFMDVVVWAAIVAPRVEMEPMADPDSSPLTESGALSYDALEDADIQYILAWTNQETAEAARFPGNLGRESGGGDSREVRPEAERPALDTA